MHLFSILKNICWVFLKLQSIWPLRATVISFHPTMCHTPFLPLAVTRSPSRHLFPAQCDNFELKQQLLCRRGLKSMWRKPVDLVALVVFMAAGQTLGACAFLVRGWAWFILWEFGKEMPIFNHCSSLLYQEFKVWFDVDNCAFKWVPRKYVHTANLTHLSITLFVLLRSFTGLAATTWKIKVSFEHVGRKISLIQ